MKIKKYIMFIVDYLFKALPISKKQVMFMSFEGQYNDNPKYISEQLHKDDPNISIVWVLSDKCHEKDSIPDYVKQVKYNSISEIFYKNTSKVLIDNGVGWRVSKSKIKIVRNSVKKKGQLNISTHHGTILKKGGADYKSGSFFDKKRSISSSDFLIAGNYYNAYRLRECYFNNLPILMTGMPRNDILLNDYSRFDIRNKLKLPHDFKLLLYAPSYRDNVIDAGIKQMNLIDAKKLTEALSSKFGGQWKMIFRSHNLVLKELKKKDFLSEYVLDGNAYDDMGEYLTACDALMTDFSGCIFDVALTKKPCFFFAHDIEKYVNRERGTYFGLNELPYPIANNFEELLDNISKYNESIVEKKRILLLSKLGNIERGYASKTVSCMIISYLNGCLAEDIINSNEVFMGYEGEFK